MPSTFTTRTARDLGVHPRELYAWRDAGEITELSRGVFRRADAPPASYPDLLAVAYRTPRAIVCCLSAAVVHDLTDELPREVQVAVPKGTHPPEISYPPAAVFRFDPGTFELGLAAVDAAPEEQVRVYDAARTVTDLMRLRHRLGEPVAHTALTGISCSPMLPGA
jgi:predicted transcriptional regulator of viral defense system